VKRKGADVLLPIAGTCVVLLSLSAFPVRLVGGQLQGAQQVRTIHEQQTASHTKAQQKQTFDGKITRSGGKLILKDNTKGFVYQVDDQQLAVFFEGKEVHITGTLDAKGDTIYISNVRLSNAKHASTKVTPLRHKPPTRIWYGVASWYERDNQGPRTANGERFDDQALTAAHRKLPLGTRVWVTNLRNGHSVLVKINDRGPFAPGRLIDLSKGAARELGFMRQGLAHVRISVVSFPNRSATS